jgi:hypothetical protein
MEMPSYLRQQVSFSISRELHQAADLAMGIPLVQEDLNAAVVKLGSALRKFQVPLEDNTDKGEEQRISAQSLETQIIG